MQDQPVMGLRPDFDGDIPFQFLFDRLDRPPVGKSQPARDPEHMGVDRDHGLVVQNGGNHVRVLRPTPGKLISALVSEGTSPSKSAISFCAIPIKYFVLLLG